MTSSSSNTEMKITYPDIGQVIRETIINEAFKDDPNKNNNGHSSDSIKSMEIRKGPMTSTSTNNRYRALLKDKTKSSQSKLQTTINNMLVASGKDLFFNGAKWISMGNTAGCPYGLLVYEGRVDRDHIPQCDQDPHDNCLCPPKPDVKNYGSYFFANRLYQRSITTVTEDKTVSSDQQGKTYVLFSMFVNKMHDLPNYRIKSHKNITKEEALKIDFSNIDMDEIEPIEDMSTENGFFPWVVMDIPKLTTDRIEFLPEKPIVSESEHTRLLREKMDNLIRKYRTKKPTDNKKNETKQMDVEYETLPCMVDIFTFNVIRHFNWEPLIFVRDINFDKDYNTIAGVFLNPDNYPISSDQEYMDVDQLFGDIHRKIIRKYADNIKQYSESVITLTNNIQMVSKLGVINSNLQNDKLPSEEAERHNELLNTIDPVITSLIGQSKTDTRIYQIHPILNNIQLYQGKLKRYNKEMKKGCNEKRMEFLKKEFTKISKKLNKECSDLNTIIESFKTTVCETKYENTMADFVSKIFQGSDTMSQDIMKQILAEEGVSKIELVPNDQFMESYSSESSVDSLSLSSSSSSSSCD